MSVITLTTDFGVDSHYVAQMKGAILGLNPSAVVVDVTHSIGPQNVTEGAFILHQVWRQFPHGTIHVAVVDPGVGTKRQILCAQVSEHFFVAPDNGLLGLVVTESKEALYHSVTEPAYQPNCVSHTFHGRDVMAPAAAYLSLGVSPERLGKQTTAMASLQWPKVVRSTKGLVGEVIYIDPFGNLITNISEVLVKDQIARDSISMEIGSSSIHGISETYAGHEADSPLAIIGSSGLLEIAINGKKAAKILDVQVGEPIRITW